MTRETEALLDRMDAERQAIHCAIAYLQSNGPLPANTPFGFFWLQFLPEYAACETRPGQVDQESEVIPV